MTTSATFAFTCAGSIASGAGIVAVVQDLTPNQNWTVLSILAVVLITVIGLLVWLVKWLCTRFTDSVDKCSASVNRCNTVVGESTQTLRTLKDAVSKLTERIDELHERMARPHADDHPRRKPL